MLINVSKEHLFQIRTITHQHLKRKNIQNKISLKVEETNNTNSVEGLDTKIKQLQTKLSQANRKSAEIINEINSLKQISMVHRTL